MDRYSPIGILDSGIGGLAIAKALKEHLPLESVIYYGDTKNFPYGEKKSDEIKGYVKKILKMLIDKDCKLIIIACNSAYSAFKIGQSKLDKVESHNKMGYVPILNIVDPMIEHVKKHCKNSNIGVIATERTIKSGIYKDLLYNNVLSFSEEVAPSLASIIEKGYSHDIKLIRGSVENHLKNPCLSMVDTLILGCTHYYWIKDLISDCCEKKIKILDAVDITVLKVKDLLIKKDMLNDNPSTDGVITKSPSIHSKAKQVSKKYSKSFMGEGLHKDIFISSRKSDNFANMVKNFFGVKTIVLENGADL